MKVPTIKQLEKYLAYPVKCALCGSEDLDGTPVFCHGERELVVSTICRNCGTEYDETYTINKVICGNKTVGRKV